MPTQFLHHRQLPGIENRHQTHWQGIELSGLYLLENRLTEGTASPDATPVLLLPGVFDPKGGDYPAPLISGMLANCRISGLYEAHYIHQGQCGRLDPQAVLQDMRNIMSHSKTPPLVVGLSGGGTFCYIALFLAARTQPQPPVKGLLLTAPSVPGYETETNLWMRRSIDNDNLVARIVEATGHPFVRHSSQEFRNWFAGSRFKAFFDGLDPGPSPPPFPIPVESCYFEQDNLNEEGQRKLHWLLNCRVHRHQFPGPHRGLHKTPESIAAIIGFVNRHA